MRCERRKEDAGQEDEMMPDFLHLSAAFLAVLGLFLWLWSGVGSAPAAPRARRNRQLARLAIFAPPLSPPLPAVGAPPPPPPLANTQHRAPPPPPASAPP